MSCIIRTKQRFVASYVIDVLLGSRQKRILENRHHTLSTWGIGKELSKEVRVSFYYNYNDSPSSHIYAQFENLNQSTMSLLSAGKAKFVPTGVFLKYGREDDMAESEEWDEETMNWKRNSTVEMLKPLPEIRFEAKTVSWTDEENADVIQAIEREIAAQEKAKGSSRSRLGKGTLRWHLCGHSPAAGRLVPKLVVCRNTKAVRGSYGLQPQPQKGRLFPGYERELLRDDGILQPP